MLHTDPGFPVRVGSGVSVGHRAVVHGCTVGDDVLVGMGAVVLNGARVGSGTLTPPARWFWKVPTSRPACWSRASRGRSVVGSPTTSGPRS